VLDPVPARPIRTVFHPDVPGRNPEPARPRSLEGPPDLPRPDLPSEPPGTGHRPAERSDVAIAETRRLMVGKDITLRGEITSCDKLVIEGNVDASMASGRELQLLKTGHFTGKVVVEEAEVAGEFSGDLTVKNRLIIRSQGRVSGDIRYGVLEVEKGGQLVGNIDVEAETTDQPPLKAVPNLGSESADEGQVGSESV
jgi:cytoskeletal protein CcmA (bactofilin family)